METAPYPAGKEIVREAGGCISNATGEKMSSFTKEIIIKTLFELLNEKPLAKITVKDVVERYGVNRNTFYYHFRDISDVVESALKREVDKAFESPVEVDSVLECLDILVKLIGENRKAMLHIYCSIQRENFTDALDKMCEYIVSQYAEHNFDQQILEKEEVKVLMHFYKCVMTGVVLDWMNHRMSYDLTDYAVKIRSLYGNTFEQTLEKAAGAKPSQLKII